MLDQLYVDIYTRLNLWLNTGYAAKFPVAPGNSPVSKPLAWIDLYTGQPDDIKDSAPHDQLPFKLPAIFVEFGIVQWQDRTQGIQSGQVPINIHVVQGSMADTYYNSAANQAAANQSKALRTLQYINQVNRSLYGFVPGAYALTAMKRVKTTIDSVPVSIVAHVLEYSVTICDDSGSAQRDWTEIPTPPFLITPDPSLVVPVDPNGGGFVVS